MTAVADDDEMTELIDADFPRVDLVGKGANGIPRFLIAKQDADSRGLVPADMVRDLIGKEADPGPVQRGERIVLPSGITVSGSPADIAAFIHKASVRESEPDGDVAKAKNDTADRKHKAATGAAMSDGSYPIADKADLGKAIRAVGRGGADHDAIRRHVIARAKALGASSEIPDNWAADGSLKEASVSKTEMVTKDMGPELDDGIDGLDPTVPLCEPDEMGPGDPADPGSPAWESIDAATAAKWLSIAARLKNALCVLAEREMLEAASADPDDAENAWDLQDAGCAMDYVISQIAVFAAGEQAEAELGAEAMAAIGKAMAGFDPAPLDTIEGLCAVAKSGRVLSAANEARIREAAGALQTVLSSLPKAPVTDDGQQVAKSKETPVAETQTAPEGTQDAAQVAKETAAAETPAADTGPVDAGGVNAMGTPKGGPSEALPGDVPGREVLKAALLGIYDQHGTLTGVASPDKVVQRVAKADGDGDAKTTMQAVFDENGNLVGIVDPADITPVAGAGGKPAADDSEDAAPAGDGDLTPQPPADAGTPADAVDDGVAKQDGTLTVTREVLKSIISDAVTVALGAHAPAEDIAKQADVSGLRTKVEALLADVEVLKEQPAQPKVFTNGQVPPAHQMRGQDQGARQVDVAKARERKAELYSAPAPEQARIAKEMQAEATGVLAAMYAAR